MKSLMILASALALGCLIGCSSSDMKPEDGIESTLKNAGVKNEGGGEKKGGMPKAEKPADAGKADNKEATSSSSAANN